MNYFKLLLISSLSYFIFVCVPPSETGSNSSKDLAELDSLKEGKMPKINE